MLLALSGGVDSPWCGPLAIKAIDSACVKPWPFREKGEPRVLLMIQKPDGCKPGICRDVVDRSSESWPIDPEQKRKIIGAEFIRVFEEEAESWRESSSWPREPLYPDIVGERNQDSQCSKIPPQCGGLPEDLNFTLSRVAAPAVHDEVMRLRTGAGSASQHGILSALPWSRIRRALLRAITRERLEAVRIRCHSPGGICKCRPGQDSGSIYHCAGL